MDNPFVREPVWCHECGCYSFEDEWETSGFGFEKDICPLCGEVFPSMYGPLENESRARLFLAALMRECLW